MSRCAPKDAQEVQMCVNEKALASTLALLAAAALQAAGPSIVAGNALRRSVASNVR